MRIRLALLIALTTWLMVPSIVATIDDPAAPAPALESVQTSSTGAGTTSQTALSGVLSDGGERPEILYQVLSEWAQLTLALSLIAAVAVGTWRELA